MPSGNLGARLARLERGAMSSASGGECDCPMVRGVSGARIIFEEDTPPGRDSRSDDVELCQVCGRPRVTFRVVFGEVDNWRSETPVVDDGGDLAEVAEATIEAARGMLDPGAGGEAA